MDAIRVYVVDDQPMIRHGVASMLASERGLLWVGEAADGAEALRGAPALAPHVILMDLAMPRMDGIAAISALRPLLPQTRFVALSSLPDPAELRRAQAAGAVGFLLKNASTAELVAAIRAAHGGQRTLAPALADALEAGERSRAVGDDLTQRERELLGLMARGLSNQEISTHLAIAMPTVKFHVTNILAKLHADNRTEAVLVALRHKIVSLH